MSDLNALCTAAEELSKDPVLRTGQALQIVLYFLILILVAVVITKKRYRRVAVHDNLKVIFANIMLLYTIVSILNVTGLIRSEVLYFTHRSPCELLVPPWQSIAVRYFGYVYTTGFPIWHLAITMERAWATLRPQGYEHRGGTYGVICSVAVWVISCTHTAIAIWLASQDDDYSHAHSYYRMTTKTNGGFLLATQYVLLALDVFTVIADCGVLHANRRHIKKITDQYNLSKSYQISENITVTMGLVLPMDMCNALIYIAFSVVATVIRNFSISFTSYQATAWYELASNLLLLQAFLSLCIFIRFVRSSKRKAKVVDSHQEADVYFQLFRKQIDAS